MFLAPLSFLSSAPLTAAALLLEVSTFKPSFPWAFTAVYVVGFIAAVSIGSLAWYNSKRPAGWEGSERPDFVPDLKPSPQESDASSSDAGDSSAS